MTISTRNLLIIFAVVLLGIGLGWWGIEQHKAELRARPTSQLTIYWENKEMYDGIDVQRKDSDTAAWRMVAQVPGDTIQYTDRGLTRSTKYCFQLIAHKKTTTMLSNAMCATSP